MSLHDKETTATMEREPRLAPGADRDQPQFGEVRHDAVPAPDSVRPQGGSKRLKDVAAWSRQLLILVRSGVPLADATNAVARQTRPGAWRSALDDVNRQLQEGRPLGEAMGSQPRFFDPVSRGLIAAGESSGQIDLMLERLAQLARQQLKLRRAVTGALIYPSLLMVVALVVILVMLCFVLPRFTGLFEMMDVALPPTTKVMLGISDVLRSNWLVLLGVIAALVGAAWAMIATGGGRRARDRWIIRVPVVGSLCRSLETARVARLLGVLLESRVPVLEAIALTRDGCSNVVFRKMLAETEEAVSRGETLSSQFDRSGIVAPSIVEAVHHGEQSSQTGTVLTTLADFMDEDNQALARTLSSVLEPVILIVLGVVVAVIALSLFVPLFDLTAMAQGG